VEKYKNKKYNTTDINQENTLQNDLEMAKAAITMFAF